jgi:hypothetical protein
MNTTTSIADTIREASTKIKTLKIYKPRPRSAVTIPFAPSIVNSPPLTVSSTRHEHTIAAATNREANIASSVSNGLSRADSSAGSLAREPSIVEDSITIDDYISRIPPLLAPVKVNGEYVHDNSTIVLKCKLGHIERHYVVSLQGSKCASCTGATKGAREARSILEKILCSPFVLVAGSSPVEYTNPLLKIRLLYTKDSTSHISSIDGYIVLSVGGTKSTLKLKQKIYGLLLSPLMIARLSTAQQDTIASILDGPRAYLLSPLPYTRELAASIGIHEYPLLLPCTALNLEECIVDTSLTKAATIA